MVSVRTDEKEGGTKGGSVSDELGELGYPKQTAFERQRILSRRLVHLEPVAKASEAESAGVQEGNEGSGKGKGRTWADWTLAASA